MSSNLSSTRLNLPLEKMPGVDRQAATLLQRLGVHRAMDVLFFFPRDYELPAPLVPEEQFAEKQRITFIGTIVDIADRFTQSGKHLFGLQMSLESGGCVRLTWFNQPFRKKLHSRGDRLRVTGVLQSTGLNWEMIQPEVVPVEAPESPTAEYDAERPRPIYPLTEGLKQSTVRTLMRHLVPGLIKDVDEALPDWVRESRHLLSIDSALQSIHFPESIERATEARRRFKFQELLVLQLALTLQRRQRERTTRAPACDSGGKVHSRILIRLGHTLTADQGLAIEQIRADMGRNVPMNRLLQGDVGSGKTLVAQYAMLLCVANEHQAALMAPTEVLARQHAWQLQKSLEESRVRVGLLTGGLSGKQRTKLIEEIGLGQVDVVVGTQALLSPDVNFKQLGLVVVDEQHKFGVLQRAKMRRTDFQPHYLVLSATPIPRTIAMTAFGDLDLSTLKEKPPGRAKVHTYLSDRHQLDSWWKFMDKQISQGRQAYVIAPRISDTSDRHAVASAEGTFKSLSEGPFRHRRLGLLHGRMSAEEKEAVLEQFISNDLDVLVATTVVEVGIDVSNATVITILDADRLGLSQLHQLRGRIARSQFTGYACAVASAGCGADDNQRLRALAATEDGFQLAEMDMKLRGPGDLLGVSQTGMPTLRIANLIEDEDLLNLARETASEILRRDPEIHELQHQRLIKQTLRRYGQSLELSGVG